ncbi:MAG: hypothetical protein CR972_01560 [Candidatus Moraniibacteriota bacterium]|nr:MAG: hypothetical protein CR972_01560 [Candidatus Moranbacteria bacterium]
MDTGGGSNFGKATKTFEVYDVEDNPLKVYKTQIVNGKYKTTTEEICDEDIDKMVCRVMNNEVVAISTKEITEENVDDPELGESIVGQVSWSVNGEAYSCDELVSEQDCRDDRNTSRVLIPFKGRDGDFVSVVANMSNMSQNTNQKQEVMRMFRVTKPSVVITPQNDDIKRKVLGTYTTLRGKKYTDESETNFEIAENSTATLSAVLYPEFLNSDEYNISYEWYINGTLYDTQKTIQYAPSADSHISVKAIFSQDNETRRALRDVFGLLESQTIPESFTQTIQLDVIKDYTKEESEADVIATVSHNAPIYIIFLLKMTLAIAVMLLIPSLILGTEFSKENMK